jgi:hypothetical protein
MGNELISKEDAAKIIEAAKEKFGGTPYEYRRGGSGTDTNKNKIPEIDCSHLVFEALNEASIKIPYEYVMTAALNSQRATIYYGIVQPEELIPGDLIVFDGHVGIVKSVYFDNKIKKIRGTFFHSESFSGGPTITGFVVDPTSIRPGYDENYYGSKKKPITRFLRPKKEPDKPAKQKIEKPKKNAEGARKSPHMYVVSTTPDVCKTPMGNSTPPVPYQIVGNLNDSASISPNVRFADKLAYLHDKSKITKVTGDEAGTAGGVKSGTNISTCESVESCKTFRVNGKQVVAHDDKFKMNNGNTFGKAVCQVSSSPASGIADGKPTEDTNPPRTV